MKKVLLLVALILFGAAVYVAYRGGWLASDVSEGRGTTGRNVVDGAERAGLTTIPNVTISQRGPGMRRQGPASLDLPVARRFDLTHVDSGQFAAALGEDPVRIFNYVRDEIAFEAYVGCLRGPRGTLLALAGNSVDRAALLASLLTQAKQKVRFVRGTLTEDVARELVSSMWAERPRPPQGTTESAPSPALTAALDTLSASVTRDYALIRDRLKRANLTIPSEPAPSLDSLVKEAQVHYWVQWWKDGTWLDLDPSFVDAAPGQTFTKAEHSSEALPEELFHHVNIRLRVEEYAVLLAGDAEVNPEIRDIFTYGARAADLSGIDVVLSHQPENWQGPAKSIQGALASALTNTGRIKPVLMVGKTLVVGKESFHQRPPRTGGIGGVFGGLGGEGTRKPVPIATAEWLQLEFVAPDGGKETVVREIFDLSGKARRAARQTLRSEEVRTRTSVDSAFDLTHAAYSLFFTTGRIDAAHFSNLAKNRQPAAGEPPGIDAFLRHINITFASISDTMLARLSPPNQRSVLSYPASPRIQVVELSTAGGKDRISLDLRQIRSRVVTIDSRPDTVFFAAVFCGVVEGTLERVLMEYLTARARQDGWEPEMSTSSMFERAAAEHVDATLLHQGVSLPKDVPGDVRARLNDAIAAGYLVLSPQRTITVRNEARLAWWQIHPKTGETIAVTDDGLHQTAVCYTERTDQDTGETEVVVRWVKGGTEFNSHTTFGIGETTEYESLISSIEHLAERLPWNEFPFQ